METGDTKFGTNVSNEISLNSTLSELSKENKQGVGGGGCSTITPVTQIRLFSRFENMIKYWYSDSIGVSLQSAFPFEVISSEWLIASLKWKSVITKKDPKL